MLSEELSEAKALEYCEEMLTRPQVTVRVNPNKTDRKDLKQILYKKYGITMNLTKHSGLGLVLKDNREGVSLYETNEY